MRSTWPILMFSLVAMLPNAIAESSITGSDATGDVTVQPAGPQMAFVDLIEASMVITETHVNTSFTPASREEDAAGAYHDPEYWVQFAFRKDTFRVVARSSASQLADPTDPSSSLIDTSQASVYRASGEGWKMMWTGDLSSSFEDSIISAAVPLSAFVGADDFTLQPGNTIVAESFGSHWDLDSSSQHDLEPLVDLASQADAGEFNDALLTVPGTMDAPVRLSTARPFRFSNGEATTYQWSIEAVASDAQDVRVSLLGAAGLVTRSPTNLHLAKGLTTFSVFATVPFAHRHGVTERLQVQLERGQAIVGSLDIGVIYPTTAQPAGHHNTLWLHSAGRTNWLNTSASDVDGASIAAQGNCMDATGARTGVSWWYPLEPRLLMGIDARLPERGDLHALLESQLPIPDGDVYARLALYDSLNRSIVTSRETYSIDSSDADTGTQPISGLPYQVDLSLSLPIPPDLDYWEFNPAQNLGLVVLYCPTAVLAQGPSPHSYANRLSAAMVLQPGGTLKLPLNEFHEALGLEAANGITMSVTPGAIQAVRPGAQAIWSVTIVARDQRDVHLEMIGSSAEASYFVGAVPASIGEEAVIVQVGFDVPADAHAGDLLEVVLVVASGPQDSAMRLAAQVDPAAMETTPIATSEQESPQPSGAMVAVALVLLAALRAQRRR